MFRTNNQNQCVMCGSTDTLTGEHKIKKSLIKSEFGNEQTYIGNVEDGLPLRLAQGPKSRVFHYKVRLCHSCNSEKTQAADRAFDKFHDAVIKASNNGHPLNSPFNEPEFAIGQPEYLNLFRFFAKHLCCFIAETGGATPIPVADFAIGKNANNPIWLDIKYSFEFEERKTLFNEENPKHASHGGLIVYCKKNGGGPTAFHSSLSIGKIQYVYWTRLTWWGRLLLRYQDSGYFKWCKDTALQTQIKDENLKRRLGL